MKPKNPRLSAALANAGMTWRQLAKSVGCTPACLHGIATGRNLPTANTAAAIAAALGLSPHDLFDKISARQAYNTLLARTILREQANQAKKDNNHE